MSNFELNNELYHYNSPYPVNHDYDTGDPLQEIERKQEDIMNQEMIEKLEKIGFNRFENTKSFFTSEYKSDDLAYIKKSMGKNHFTVSKIGRHLFFGMCLWSHDSDEMG